MFGSAHHSSRQMRLPGCRELESGVPAPTSLWARSGNNPPFERVPLLDGSLQRVISRPVASQAGEDLTRSFRTMASPRDVTPATLTSFSDSSPPYRPTALLFSSLPSRPSDLRSSSVDRRADRTLMPYKYRNTAEDTPYASSIGSSWSPPSSASSFSPALASDVRLQANRLDSNRAGFFVSPPPFFPSPSPAPHYARDAINQTATSPPLGRLRPVDPSWCAESESHGPCPQYPSGSDVSAPHEIYDDEDGYDDPETGVRCYERKRARAPGRGKPEGEAHTTALDNDPPPFNLDKDSFTVLKDHLWIRDGSLPPSYTCSWRDCGRHVSTGESQIPTHYADVHGLTPGSKRVQCRWVEHKGKTCKSFTSFHNYRLHILDVHLQANRGRCKVCHHRMTNSGGMKRHLKRCLRPRTVDEMWQRYGVHVVLPPPGDEDAQGHCYVSP